MTDRPNILVILTDDHGQWANGCYGNREIETPNLDYLADNGVRMANAFTPTPVCSPARASFFTGLFASQHGIHDWLYHFQPTDINERDWLADEITLAQLLQEAGYQTALSGKWHCSRDDHPASGFDHWHALRRNYPPQEGEYSLNGEIHDAGGYHTDHVTDYAIDFLRARDEARPFFLFVGYIGTHSPWRDHPERIVSRYRDCTFDDVPADTIYPFGRLAGESTQNSRFNRREALAQYYASVTHIDEGVGQLLDALEATGQRENTLVVYTSDHGLNCGHHGVWGKGNGTRPLNMLEESIRVPLIFNHPGALFAGQARAEFVDHTDLFATLLDYAGIAAPTGRAYPGRSYASILRRAQPVPNWKDAQFGEYGEVRMIRTRRFKLVTRGADGPHELFDLLADPRETVNLYYDAGYRPVVTDLTARIAEFFAIYEHPEKSGLRVRELPQHNFNEGWRDEQA